MKEIYKISFIDKGDRIEKILEQSIIGSNLK